MRAYGFQTFGELFDEAYDEEAEPRRRFEAVCAQLERFCRDGRAELPRLVASVEEKLRFNAWRGLVELPRLFRSELQPALVTALLDRLKLQAGGGG